MIDFKFNFVDNRICSRIIVVGNDSDRKKLNSIFYYILTITVKN